MTIKIHPNLPHNNELGSTREFLKCGMAGQVQYPHTHPHLQSHYRNHSPRSKHHCKGRYTTINGGSSIGVELTKEQVPSYRKRLICMWSRVCEPRAIPPFPLLHHNYIHTFQNIAPSLSISTFPSYTILKLET